MHHTVNRQHSANWRMAGRAVRPANVGRFDRILLAWLVLCVATVVLGGCASAAPARQEPTPPISIEAVRLTAAGHYVDLRYRVLDPARANELLGPGVKPILIDQATGAQMGVPMTAKLGPLRQTQAVQKPDHLYFVMFVNSAGVRPGSHVTAELGGIKIADLIVQ
jgi:hypothetical protein